MPSVIQNYFRESPDNNLQNFQSVQSTEHPFLTLHTKLDLKLATGRAKVIRQWAQKETRHTGFIVILLIF